MPASTYLLLASAGLAAGADIAQHFRYTLSEPRDSFYSSLEERDRPLDCTIERRGSSSLSRAEFKNTYSQKRPVLVFDDGQSARTEEGRSARAILSTLGEYSHSTVLSGAPEELAHDPFSWKHEETVSAFLSRHHSETDPVYTFRADLLHKMPKMRQYIQVAKGQA
eukprot:SAG11_NODE_621_length_8169_cov_2.866914_12_plen_166_part_00